MRSPGLSSCGPVLSPRRWPSGRVRAGRKFRRCLRGIPRIRRAARFPLRVGDYARLHASIGSVMTSTAIFWLRSGRSPAPCPVAVPVRLRFSVALPQQDTALPDTRLGPAHRCTCIRIQRAPTPASRWPIPVRISANADEALVRMRGTSTIGPCVRAPCAGGWPTRHRIAARAALCIGDSVGAGIGKFRNYRISGPRDCGELKRTRHEMRTATIQANFAASFG